MSDTNDQYDLRSFANEQGDVRSVANKQPGQSNANEQSDQPAVVSAQHGRNDQSGRTYLKLVHSRSGHKTCITKHRDRINSIRSSYPVTDLAGLRISLAVIRETLTSISEKDRLIEDVVPDERLQAELETACEFRAEIREFIQQTNDFLEDQQAPSRGSTGEANGLHTMFSPRSSQIKLPKIDLPSFSGKYTEWTSFIDQFDSAVHGNPNLQNAETLNYLKSSLRGEAHDLIKNVAVTDVNYELARRTLMDRFDNKRFIVSMHLSAVLHYPTLKTEDGTSLRKLLECLRENVVALEVQGCNTQDWDPILVHVIEQKLDPESQKQWQLHNPGREHQKLHELDNFISARARALEAVKSSITLQKPTTRIEAHAYVQSKIDRRQSYRATTVDEQCVFCGALHTVTACNEFKKLKVHTRKDEVTSKRLCFNCLRPGHLVTKCPSTHNCKQCGKRHHSLLHVDNQHREQNTPERNTINDCHTSGNNLCTAISATEPDRTALLGTCRIPLFNHHRQEIICRALIDNGSQLKFVSDSFVRRHGLPRKSVKQTVKPVGTAPPLETRGLAPIKLSLPGEDTLRADFFIMPQVTSDLPADDVDVREHNLPSRYALADPNFDKRGRIDLLCGVELANELTTGKRIREGSLSLDESIFGWIVSGSVQFLSRRNDDRILQANFVSQVSDLDINRLWTVDDLPSNRSPRSNEEDFVEDHYDKTTVTESDGCFCVILPFETNVGTFDECRANAPKPFFSLERKLKQDVVLYTQYQDFIKEFRDMGHLEELIEVFWKRWSKEYLSSLEPRKEWNSKQRLQYRKGSLRPALHKTKQIHSQC